PGCSVSTGLTPAELTTTKTLTEVNRKAATEGQTLLPGDTLTYTITIENEGAATEPTLTDHVPANTTYAGVGEGWTPCVAAPGTPSAAGTECTQKVPVPAATTTGGPGKATVHFTVKVDNPLTVTPATEITNFVHSSQGTCNAAPETEPGCSVSTGLTPAELTTTKTLTEVNGKAATEGQTLLPGDTLTYTITIENEGAATEPTLTDHVPANTTYAGVGEGWTPCVAAPGTPSAAGTECTQKVPVPAATTTGGPGKATVHFTVKVDNPLTVTPATEITNFVHSSQGTCNAAPETEPGCSVSTGLTPAELTTTKTLTEVNGKAATEGQTLLPGDTLTYTITIENEGAATEPTLTDHVPANTTYAGVGEGWTPCVAAPGTPSAAGTECTQKVPVPAATTTGGPGKATVHFTVKVDNPLTVTPATEITNFVHSSQGTCNAAPETEPGCSVSTGLTPAELTTTKTLTEVNGKAATEGQTLLPGDTLTYTITIENEGAATEPTLTDHVPANTTYAGVGEGWTPCVAAPGTPSAAGTECTQKVPVPAATTTGGPGKATVHFTVKVDNPLTVTPATEITNFVHSSQGTCNAAPETEPGCSVSTGLTPAELTTTKTLTE